jgi:hypothetical protein
MDPLAYIHHARHPTRGFASCKGLFHLVGYQIPETANPFHLRTKPPAETVGHTSKGRPEERPFLLSPARDAAR